MTWRLDRYEDMCMFEFEQVLWTRPSIMNHYVRTKLFPTAPLAITGHTSQSRLRKLYKWIIKNADELKQYCRPFDTPLINLALNGVTFYNGKIYTAFPHAINSVMQYHCIVCSRPFHASTPMTSHNIGSCNNVTAYICDKCPREVCVRTFFDKSTCARRKVTFALCIRVYIKGVSRLLLRRVDKCNCGHRFLKLPKWLTETK
jgi:hypothetical protein